MITTHNSADSALGDREASYQITGSAWPPSCPASPSWCPVFAPKAAQEGPGQNGSARGRQSEVSVGLAASEESAEDL